MAAKRTRPEQRNSITRRPLPSVVAGISGNLHSACARPSPLTPISGSGNHRSSIRNRASSRSESNASGRSSVSSLLVLELTKIAKTVSDSRQSGAPQHSNDFLRLRCILECFRGNRFRAVFLIVATQRNVQPGHDCSSEVARRVGISRFRGWHRQHLRVVLDTSRLFPAVAFLEVPPDCLALGYRLLTVHKGKQHDVALRSHQGLDQAFEGPAAVPSPDDTDSTADSGCIEELVPSFPNSNASFATVTATLDVELGGYHRFPPNSPDVQSSPSR